jgi:hypothetical protein
MVMQLSNTIGCVLWAVAPSGVGLAASHVIGHKALQQNSPITLHHKAPQHLNACAGRYKPGLHFSALEPLAATQGKASADMTVA